MRETGRIVSASAQFIPANQAATKAGNFYCRGAASIRQADNLVAASSVVKLQDPICDLNGKLANLYLDNSNNIATTLVVNEWRRSFRQHRLLALLNTTLSKGLALRTYFVVSTFIILGYSGEFLSGSTQYVCSSTSLSLDTSSVGSWHSQPLVRILLHLACTLLIISWLLRGPHS